MVVQEVEAALAARSLMEDEEAERQRLQSEKKAEQERLRLAEEVKEEQRQARLRERPAIIARLQPQAPAKVPALFETPPRVLLSVPSIISLPSPVSHQYHKYHRNKFVMIKLQK